jgi:hypothetical protein
MRRLLFTIAASGLLTGVADAQTLQHRLPPVAGAASASSSNARKALPEMAEGEYRWGEPGEVIELYIENGALGGYLTRRSDRHDARSSPLTFTFARAAIVAPATTSGQAGASGQGRAATITFRTRRIHGDWYSFTGRVERGPAADVGQDGYYLLQGTLSAHLSPEGPGDESASDKPVSRQVSLKLSATSRCAP